MPERQCTSRPRLRLCILLVLQVVGGRQRSVRRSLAAALEAACEQDFPYGSSSFAKYLQRVRNALDAIASWSQTKVFALQVHVAACSSLQ